MANIKTESTSSGVKPGKKMKLWKKVLIGIGIFILLVIIISFSATSGIAKVAEKQLNLISSGDLKGAYALTSQEFQGSVSYDNFIKYINSYEVLKNYKGHSFSSRDVQGNNGTIKGTLTAKDGTSMAVEYKLVKENNDWKILSIDLKPSENTSTANKDTMKTFSDSALGYSFQYPKDWTYEKKNASTILLSGPKEKNMFDVTLNIQNMASKNHGGIYSDTDSVVKDLKNQIRGMDKNATFSDVSEINFTRTDGIKLAAKSFASKLTNQGKKFVLAQVVVPHGDNLTFHVLGYTSPADKFDADFLKTTLENWQINK